LVSYKRVYRGDKTFRGWSVNPSILLNYLRESEDYIVRLKARNNIEKRLSLVIAVNI
jgi:hypothetical protein